MGLDEVPRDHPFTVTIPGCVDGLTVLSEELGRLPLNTTLEPALALASDGFRVSHEQAMAFERLAPMIGDNPAVTDFYPDGKTVSESDHITRHNLASTLEALSAGGRQAFYAGRAGEDIVEAVEGLITMKDMTEIQADWIEPIGVPVAGLTAWTVPPNSQGYLGPAALAVLEMLDPPKDPDDPLAWHLLIESYRALAWERNDLVSDARYAQLPAELLMASDRLERVAATVSHRQAGVWPDRIGATSGTAYLCTSDSDGMAVSIIQSNYRGIGSFFGAARSGFMLQDRGGGFGLTPGHPNELGPNKRPLHTLAPTLWTQGSNPAWILGTRGGAVQPQLVAQVGTRSILRGEDLEQAQSAPRWIVEDFGPGSRSRLAVEPGLESTLLADLRSRGHEIEELSEPQPGWGPVSIIDVSTDETRAAADPRVDTTSALVF